jgi:RNA 3'-terminal phosphate cyclase (ATP)
MPVELFITTWGWYPMGGGQVSARITPARALTPFKLTERGRPLRITGISAISNLPYHIAARQRSRALEVLSSQGIDASIEVLSAPSPGRGSFLFLSAEFEHISAGFGSLGAIGKRAEQVADEACKELLSYLRTKGALDPYLADQIVLWLAFCQGPSEFTTSRITRHLLTNVWVMQQFMNIDARVEGYEGEEGRIVIHPYPHGPHEQKGVRP